MHLQRGLTMLKKGANLGASSDSMAAVFCGGSQEEVCVSAGGGGGGAAMGMGEEWRRCRMAVVGSSGGSIKAKTLSRNAKA
jgi:hypothetical protein